MVITGVEFDQASGEIRISQATDDIPTKGTHIFPLLAQPTRWDCSRLLLQGA